MAVKKEEEKKEQEFKAHRHYKVLADKIISWFGAMTWLHKDDVIDEAGYGTDGIKRLKEQGVQLQRVE